MPRLRQPSEPLPVHASTATRVVASDRVNGARGSIFAFAIAADIQTQFLVESVTVTLAGSAIGFVVGIIIAEAGTAGFRLWAHAPIYPVMHFSTGLLAAGSAVIVGLIFGTYPAQSGRARARGCYRAGVGAHSRRMIVHHSPACWSADPNRCEPTGPVGHSLSG